eukprot:363869-Chlamydomonas_euryale.AAC.25
MGALGPPAAAAAAAAAVGRRKRSPCNESGLKPLACTDNRRRHLSACSHAYACARTHTAGAGRASEGLRRRQPELATPSADAADSRGGAERWTKRGGSPAQPSRQRGGGGGGREAPTGATSSRRRGVPNAVAVANARNIVDDGPGIAGDAAARRRLALHALDGAPTLHMAAWLHGCCCICMCTLHGKRACRCRRQASAAFEATQMGHICTLVTRSGGPAAAIQL